MAWDSGFELYGFPRQILDLSKKMSILSYVIFVNGLTFIVKMLLGVNLTMVQYIGKHTEVILAKSIK